MTRHGTLLAPLLLFVSVAASGAPTAIYVNGKVWTGGNGFAEAFVIEGERFGAVGANAEIRALAGEGARIVDLGGKLVVPGFIDNHTHFRMASLALSAVDLRDAATPAEFTRRIAARAKERPGEWITLGIWDHELWGSTLPTREWIDAVTGNTPVFVQRLDGHMGLANSAALRLAGIDERSRNPLGGTIVRDATGNPTGLLKDAAMEAVFKVIPPPAAERIDEALQRGFQEALSHGVTQVHDMSDGNWSTLEAFRRARAQGRLGIRVYSFVPVADWEKMEEFVRANGRGDDWLRWGAVKGFVDGSLGSTTAWFHEPYTDAPETSGLVMGDLDALERNIRESDRAGLHVTIHAIGDRANDWLLDVFERLNGEAAGAGRRFRVEHAQHLTAEAIRRFGTLGVIPSMQPYHAIDDGRWAENRIGLERLKGTYAFRSLLDAKAALTFGSDWPVAPLDPIRGIDAAVTRRTIDGRNANGWQPQERITVAEALHAYTAANAHAGFQDDRLGRVAPGYLADFAVLSDDIFSVEPNDVANTRVLSTVIGGVERYKADETADRDEIAAVIEQYRMHEETGDMLAQSRLMTDDRVMMYVGDVLKGDNRKLMQEQRAYMEKFQAEFPGVRYEIEIRNLDIRLWGATALATFEWHPRRVVPAELPPEKVKALDPPKMSLLYALVLAKRDDGWKIAFTTFVPPAEGS